MARQRFPTLQPGPDARETTGLTKGSRRPSAVMIFFALGASLTVLSLEAVSPLAAGLGVSLAALCGANGVAGLAAAFFAAEVVFCAPCLGCVATGRTAILVGAGLLGAICAVLLSFLSAEAAGFAAVVDLVSGAAGFVGTTTILVAGTAGLLDKDGSRTDEAKRSRDVVDDHSETTCF